MLSLACKHAGLQFNMNGTVKVTIRLLTPFLGKQMVTQVYGMGDTLQPG